VRVPGGLTHRLVPGDLFEFDSRSGHLEPILRTNDVGRATQFPSRPLRSRNMSDCRSVPTDSRAAALVHSGGSGNSSACEADGATIQAFRNHLEAFRQ
jgi:hypothetical protein